MVFCRCAEAVGGSAIEPVACLAYGKGVLIILRFFILNIYIYYIKNFTLNFIIGIINVFFVGFMRAVL
jgi:hypothetical protein